MTNKKPEIKSWKNLVENVLSEKKKTVKIAVIAKYIATGDYELKDSYHSLLESLEHASWYHKTNIDIEFVHAEKLEKNDKAALEKLSQADGIVVPIGWGSRGVEGKIKAIEFARVNKVPYLGLCYGMQLACVEYARNVVGLEEANSTEVNEDTKYPN